MKNLVLTFLLALLVVATALSIRRMVVGNTPSAAPALMAIGTSPVPNPQPPPPPPPPTK